MLQCRFQHSLAVHAFGDFDFLYCLQCFRSGVAKRSQRLYRILEGIRFACLPYRRSRLISCQLLLCLLYTSLQHDNCTAVSVQCIGRGLLECCIQRCIETVSRVLRIAEFILYLL